MEVCESCERPGEPVDVYTFWGQVWLLCQRCAYSSEPLRKTVRSGGHH